MPWIEHRLNGQTVLAKVDESGALLVEDGRVEVRYKPRDGRAYRAGARNLERIATAATYPDDHCAPGEAPPPKTAKKAGASGATTKAPGAKHATAAHHHTSKAEIVVYADGACAGNPGPAGLGVLIEIDGERRELSEYLGHGTNNVGELTAIQRAAEALAGEKRHIEIKTDSKYAIGVLTQGWKAKANKELIAEVKKALATLPHVHLTYVPGHSGVAGNERADELATAAVAHRKSTHWKTR